MIDSVRKIDFSDYTEGVPAFLTLALMPLTYSIGDGLTVGVISYALINLLSNIFGKEKKKVSLVMYILAIVFILKIVFASH